MLSLKVFDRSHGEEMVVAYRRAATSILEALLHQTIAGDESDHASFRDSMAVAAAQMTAGDAKPPDVLMAAGAASSAIHEYNRHVVAAVRGRRAELEAVVGMLTQTMAEVGAGSERSLGRLRDIERRLTRSEEIFDVRDLRKQMADCLVAVREEAALRKQESDRLVADLKTAVRERDQAVKAATVKPAVRTGPGHDAIEEKIARAAGDRADFFVAVLAIDHLNPVIARFGEAAAARVAAFCAGQASAALSDRALGVFVWKGRACVVVLDGAAGAQALEQLILREAQQRRSLLLEHSGREVMLHVSYSKWLLLPGAGASVASIVGRMNEFLAQVAAAPQPS